MNEPYEKNDPVYLRTSQYEEPKESFKAIFGIIRETYGDHPISLVDVGCASGSFIYFAQRTLNVTECLGTDISDAHLEQAKEKIADAEFRIYDVLRQPNPFQRTFDVCTCIGTVSIFDEINVALENLLTFVKKGGCLIIYDLINDYPVDVHMKYRHVLGEHPSEWYAAFNVRSRETYESILKNIDPDIVFRWIDFEMPFAIPQSSNPLRAWTIQTEFRPYQLVVGTGQLLNFKILQAIRSTD